MNNDVYFLKKLHILAGKLNNDKADIVIDEIKDLVIECKNILTDDCETNFFIEKLIYFSERNMEHKDIPLFIKHLDDFFVHFLLLKKCDVFYIGKKDNIDLIYHSIPKEYIGNTHATFLDGSKASAKFDPFIDKGIDRPYLVFDDQGLEFLKKIIYPQAICRRIILQRIMGLISLIMKSATYHCCMNDITGFFLQTICIRQLLVVHIHLMVFRRRF